LFHQEFLFAIDTLKGIRYSDMIGMFFWGATSVLMFFIFFLFLKAKEFIYLHYSLFLFFIIIYGLTHLVAFPGVNLKLLNILRGNRLLGEPMVLTSFAFYSFFASSLLNVPRQNKKIARFLNALGISCLGYSVLYIIIFELISPIDLYIFAVVRAILFPVCIYGIIWIYRSIQSPVKFYFIIGSAAYFIGALVASFRHIDIPFPYHWIGNLTSTAYFEIGILLQAIFFAMALGQRIVILHEEKLAADKALIEQLRANHRISLEANKALEIEVENRVSELIKVKEDLQEQETKRLQADLMNSQIRAKQAQVNPHFIYNSMNALKYMIQKNKNQEAISYLVRFSRMVRVLLERSEENTITLSKEIEYIKNYIELEKERFKGFEYSIEIEDEVPMHKIPIPPLLLQPIVEHTIWQYLSNSTNILKKFCIFIKNKNNKVIISIFNEGVINSASNSQLEERVGIKLAKERIELFNKQSTSYHIELSRFNEPAECNNVGTNFALIYHKR